MDILLCQEEVSFYMLIDLVMDNLFPHLCCTLLHFLADDNTLKLWDIRNFSQPVHVREDLWNLFPVLVDMKLNISGTNQLIPCVSRYEA